MVEDSSHLLSAAATAAAAAAGTIQHLPLPRHGTTMRIAIELFTLAAACAVKVVAMIPALDILVRRGGSRGGYDGVGAVRTVYLQARGGGGE